MKFSDASDLVTSALAQDALDAARREASYRDLLRIALAQLAEARASEAVLRARVAAQADQLRHMLRVE